MTTDAEYKAGLKRYWNMIPNLLDDYNLTSANEWDYVLEQFKLVCGYYGDEVGDTYTGDMLDSNSPMDPSFWPIHPTMERVMSKFLLNMAGTEDWSWPAHNSLTSTSDTACTGHEPTDIMDLPGLFTAEDSGKANMTVVDYTKMLSPYNNEVEVDYVYQDFLWDHCVAGGIPASFYYDASSSTSSEPLVMQHWW